MATAITLGNGNILVNLNEHGLLQDFYFPHVGLENHVGVTFTHKIGVWVEGNFSWLDDGHWDLHLDCSHEALASNISAFNNELEVTLYFDDVCYNEKNIFLRKVAIKNAAERPRQIKVFFCQQFELYESRSAHTAYYDPDRPAMIHYRNHRAFLINAQLEGVSFDDYTAGVFGAEGKEGSFRDAEDGLLSKNTIEHGQADSVIAVSADYAPHDKKIAYYWLAAGLTIDEVKELDDEVLAKGAGHMVRSTRDYWHAWVNRQNFSFEGLSDPVVKLFKKSLFYVRAHADNNGAIIASADSTMLQKGKDTYAYMWPRDAAYTCMAFNHAGDYHLSRRFFTFCNEVITEEGYFMHKYSPDMSLGSSWHGWITPAGSTQLPIQEDETAIILWALWDYYQLSKDLEFIELVYNSLIRKAANFLVLYRDESTKLPLPSYDLWEEKCGVHTYTVGVVYGALITSARFSKLLGKIKDEHRYLEAAAEIKEAALKYLYNPETGLFRKSLSTLESGKITYDETIDISSVAGLFEFGLLTPDEPILEQSMANTFSALTVGETVGGIGRYVGDRYYRQDGIDRENPWFVTTLWQAQYNIAKAKDVTELESVKETLAWCVRYAKPSGVLSEQLHPKTGEQLSAAPLVWSHAEYVRTVIAYLDRLEDFGVCVACNPVY
jgi:GH15 family glucan-1,4-alpha-glucosidase